MTILINGNIEAEWNYAGMPTLSAVRRAAKCPFGALQFANNLNIDPREIRTVQIILRATAKEGGDK